MLHLTSNEKKALEKRGCSGISAMLDISAPTYSPTPPVYKKLCRLRLRNVRSYKELFAFRQNLVDDNPDFVFTLVMEETLPF